MDSTQEISLVSISAVKIPLCIIHIAVKMHEHIVHPNASNWEIPPAGDHVARKKFGTSLTAKLNPSLVILTYNSILNLFCKQTMLQIYSNNVHFTLLHTSK